jgi:hypothetical protein
MKRLILPGAILGALVLGALVPGAAFAHGGGHQGGCAAMGLGFAAFSQNPAPWSSTGDLVSFLALDGTGRGVGDVVEDFDHLLCGPQ